MKKNIFYLIVLLFSCSTVEIPVDVHKEKSLSDNCDGQTYYVRTSSSGNYSNHYKPFPLLISNGSAFTVFGDSLKRLDLNSFELVSFKKLDLETMGSLPTAFALSQNDRWWHVRCNSQVDRANNFSVTLLDTTGSIVKSSSILTYMNNGFPQVYITATNDNGCLITVHGSWEAADAPIKFSVYRFNSELELMWSKIFVSNFEIEKITQTRSGDFLLCGYIESHTDHFDPKGYVNKLDKDGNLIWSRKMGESIVFDVVELSDNRYAFLKQHSYGLRDVCYLEVTDNMGVEKWTSSTMQNPKFIYTTSGKIIVGYQKLYADTGYDILLKCMDVNGNTEWAKIFGGTGDEMLYNILEIPEVGYYLFGQSKEYTGDGYTLFNSYELTYSWVNNFNDKNYIVKTDLLGNSCK